MAQTLGTHITNMDAKPFDRVLAKFTVECQSALSLRMKFLTQQTETA